MTGLFDTTQMALERALSGASMRQEALANNLANVNTPGFKRSDVDFHGVLAAALESGLQDQVDEASFAPVTDTQSAMRADGNNVDADQEMAALSQNGLEYEALVSIARERLQMISMVVGRS